MEWDLNFLSTQLSSFMNTTLSFISLIYSYHSFIHYYLPPRQEHVIHVWQDELPLFHTVLALQYKERITVLMDDYRASLQPGKNTVIIRMLQVKIFVTKIVQYTSEK